MRNISEIIGTFTYQIITLFHVISSDNDLEFTDRSSGSGRSWGFVLTSSKWGSKAESTMISNPGT